MGRHETVPCEARDLAEPARAAGIHTAVGLQARFSPAVRHARELVADGYVGEVLGTTLVGSGIARGGETDRAHGYMFDVSNGATTLSVSALHALDALLFVLGELATVNATMAVRRPVVRLVEDGSTLPVTAPDQIAIDGTLTSGAVASVFYRGGVSRGQNLRWEINGSDGDLVLTSVTGNLQVADLSLAGGRGDEGHVRPIALPSRYAQEPGGLSGEPGANVLRLYAHLGSDIRDGTRTVPDFEHALRRHHLLATIEQAAHRIDSRDIDR